MGVDSSKTAILRAALTIRLGDGVIRDCETAADLQLAFSQIGVAISSDQLRRWRDQGLMPNVRQVGLGKAAGSVIEYPKGTAQLAVEIHRLLAIKKKMSFVGWHLWMQGYSVDEKYWKPLLEAAANELRRIPAWLKVQEGQEQDDSETIYDRLSKGQFVGTLFAKGVAKLAPEMTAYVFGFLAEVARGRLHHSVGWNELDDSQNRKALVQFIGQSPKSIVANVPIDEQFGSELQDMLSAISQLLAKIQSRPIGQTLERAKFAKAQYLNFANFGADLISPSNTTGKSHIDRFAQALLLNPKVQSYALIIFSEGTNHDVSPTLFSGPNTVNN